MEFSVLQAKVVGNSTSISSAATGKLTRIYQNLAIAKVSL